MTSDVVLRGIRRQFGERVVLSDFGLTLAGGAVTAITGPNGSGKTTVARLVLGLDSPDAGTIEGIGARRRAAVFQENRLCAHLSAASNVRLVLDRTQWGAADEQLLRVGLPTDALKAPVGALSGGQRRRVAIVRALAGNADLLVLDEPCAGIDTEGKPAVLDYIRQRAQGRTTLLITHDLSESEWLGARTVRMP
jgi:NitT/TauT family transport system ATP-binding protein